MNIMSYERIIVDPYRFKGFHGCDSWCRVEILPGTEDRTIVIVTELPDNPGTTITNAVDWLIPTFGLRFGIDLSHLIWIEHYAAPSGNQSIPREFTRVLFDVISINSRLLINNVRWRPLRQPDWLALGIQPRNTTSY